VGTSGQVLTSTVTGVAWAAAGGSGFTYKVTDQTTTYAANSYDDVWCTGTFTVTLPAQGTTVRVKVSNRGTGTITVVPSSGLINGSASLTIARQYDSAEFASDGTNWGVE